MTVGASTDDGVTALFAQVIADGQPARNIEMRLLDGSKALASPAVELEYVRCATGARPGDFPKSVKGKIALIQRGEITFLEKAQNAEKAGAVAAVIYNNREGNFFGSLGGDTSLIIPVVSISKVDGDSLLQAFTADDPEAVSKARLRLSPDQIPQPDHMAEFSSRGPNNDGWMKPELTAPGVNIRSATITQAPSPGGGMPDASGYTNASGTSMATPHVAGACALLRQAHPDWSSMQMKAALVNTARFMSGQGTVMDQGNGAIDLVKAIDCRGILVTAADPFAPTHAFGQVVNEGKTVTVSQALTIQSLVQGPDDSTYSLSVELAANPQGLTTELSAQSVVCNPTCVASFDLKLTADGAVLADGPYYGWVVARAAWGTLRLPFYYEAAKQASTPPAPAGGTRPQLPPQRWAGLDCC